MGIGSLTWIALIPGLSGSFLFDDAPNLEKLGSLGPISNWELFRVFVFGGGAGPLGRPISLASFLINANDWPADPASFKYTNILIHLLIGVILFSTIRKLMYSIGRSAIESDWVALLATALWLLNPFLVSTTLYVVQRMTQLCTLFSILGIFVYLQGRLWLPTKRLFGYSTITLGICLTTLLAAYSKENGILLPTLILVIEFSLRDHWKTRSPNWRWQALFLGIPTITILIYIISFLPSATKPLATRDFTVAQRLLTEPRILLEYLFYLLVPHIQSRGLYQDGITLSTGLFSPWTTFIAIASITGLVISGWLARRKWPIFSLSMLFFFAGHLLESTTPPLELYFEHRNYLPAIFLFLPIASSIEKLWKKKKPLLALSIALIFFSSYTFATWQCSRLWGDFDKLMLVWAEMNPRSPRAQNSAVQTWVRLNRPDLALNLLDESRKKMPESALLTANYLSYRAYLGILSPQEFMEGANRLRRQPFDAQILLSLKYLVETLNANAPLPDHSSIMMDLLENMRNDLKGKIPVAHRYTYYLQGLLLSGQGDAEGSYNYLNEALLHYKKVETALHIVSMLAMHNQLPQALGMLEQSKHLLDSQSDKELGRYRSTYEQEISRLRDILKDNILNNSQPIPIKSDGDPEKINNR